MKHVIVKIGDYTIPLIGISPSATQMECDLCRDIFHITDVHLTKEGKQFLCRKCLTIYNLDKVIYDYNTQP